MRMTQRIILLTILLTNAVGFSAAYAANSCPPISTAIQQIGAVNLTAATGAPGHWHYTGTSSYDGAMVDYYSTIQPTKITPNRQIQRLQSILSVPTQLSEEGAIPVVCAYLGSLNNAAPVYDATWQQAIIITSNGVTPTPTPTPTPGQSVAVTTNITGLPSNAKVNITLNSLEDDVVLTQSQAIGVQPFATVRSGNYFVSADNYAVGNTVYAATNILPSYTLSGDQTLIPLMYVPALCTRQNFISKAPNKLALA